MKNLTLITIVVLLISKSLQGQPCTTGLHHLNYNCLYGSAIDDFSLSNVNQINTGCSGYDAIDYTSLNCNLAKGESYIFSMTSTSYYTSADYAAIWIDFNDNGSFSDNGEMLFSSTNGGEFSGTINIPLNAPVGLHRLRVRLNGDYSPMNSLNACTFYYYGETQDYTANITAAPACHGIASINISNIALQTADVSWACNSCTGTFIIEYGLTGFTPGTGAIAGTGGTVVNTNASPVSLSGLNSSVEYSVYIRSNCGVDGYSQNFGPVNFETSFDVCATLSTITCGTPVTSVVPAGAGAYDATNCYDYQYGKENIFEFTSSGAGTYTITTNSYGPGIFSYKEAITGCNNSGWNCPLIDFNPGTYLLGSLTANTTYYILHDNSSTSGISTDFQIDCFTPYFPCDSIDTLACGVQKNGFISSGVGAFSNTQCQYYQNLGKERIYAFIPAVSGNHTFTFTQNSGYYTAGISYKKASLGCDENNWNCITETSFDNTYLIGYLLKDTTYYFLEDAYSLTGVDINLQIDCVTPSTPCASPVVVSCDSVINFSVASGSGAFNISGCVYSGNIPVGKEIIYQFTPSTTGSSSIHTINSNGFPVIYYFKEVVSGCNANGWICLGESNMQYLIIPGTLNAGTSYYILADATNYNGGTQSFEITCPESWNPCSSITPLTCAATATAFIPEGIGAYNQSTNLTQLQCMSNSVIGKELIYSFSPTVTGTHALNVLYTDYINGISYLIKDAASGCNDLNWTCIGGTAYPTYLFGYPFYIPIQLVSGHTYYIMLKAFNYIGATHDFSITCPVPFSPCDSIESLSCGDTGIVNITSGLGAFLSGGRENIFEFTPAVSGNHLLNVESFTYDETVSYYIKPASGGCNNSNWISFANAYYGTYTFAFPFSLTAGESYFIMADGALHDFSAIQQISIACAVVASDPCASITPISGCGVPVISLRASGLGSLGSVNSCINSEEPGKESIFEFIAPVTGNYSLSGFTGGSGTELFFIKEAISICDNNGWQCINSSLSLVSGSHYYIMVDGSDTLGSSITFQIDCPNPDPCLSAFPSITCGYQNSNNVTIPSGAGSLTVNSCNTYHNPVGREVIYSFVPAQSGSYYLNANNITSQSVFFFIKNALSGCNSAGWNCITNSYTYYISSQQFPYDLIAGNTYYIMVDNADTYGTTLSFDITCASGCVQNADNDGDGFGDPNNANYSCFPVLGYVPDNTDCNDNNSSIHINCVNYTYYKDFDLDTYGNPNDTIESSSLTPPAGYVTNNDDCNDGNLNVYPGATEVCNGYDDDCDGLIDLNDPSLTDNQNPAITCPGNITLNNDPNACGALVTFNVTATDNCLQVSVVSVPASGTFFQTGTTTVTSTATDVKGNISTCSFTLTVLVPGLDDNNACTIDVCNAGVVTHTNLAGIDDNNHCTADACDPVTGDITHTPIVGSVNINLQGNGNNIVSGSIATSTTNKTDFGHVVLGASRSVTYTIQNTGTTTLNIGAISITGANPADFMVTRAPAATVAGGSFTTFVVKIKPLVLGARNAVINIAHNACVSQPYTFAVSGNGINRPPVALSE